MILSTNLGYPRVGPRRELKTALEAYWQSKSDADRLLSVQSSLLKDRWLAQKKAGLDHVPSNDFSLYDHVLDTAAMLGAVPKRYGWSKEYVDLKSYFAMARGVDKGPRAMEMTKWFDTNYHYIVPELAADQTFRLSSLKPFEEFIIAKSYGVVTRPVLLGPVTFLKLAKPAGTPFDTLTLLDKVLPVYEDVLRKLSDAGAEWVQIDEPILALDLDPAALTALDRSFNRLAAAAPRLRLLLASYFEGLHENLRPALELPVAALHLDLVTAPDQLDAALAHVPKGMTLSLGVVDGRGVWRTDLERALDRLDKARRVLGPERLMVAPSCSLLHAPLDLALEDELDPEIKSWLAFGVQKIDEVVLLTRASEQGRKAFARELAASKVITAARKTSPKALNPAVRARTAAVTPAMARRTPYPRRRQPQRAALNLPALPTTTIGSFPQTAEVRAARAARKTGTLDAAGYESFLRAETEKAIRWQEEVGLDVLVHGEFERNDMVEYFGERLSGFAFTRFGWVQSYGSRCVKPPIIYGDVSRPQPMTVKWASFAQSLTEKPVKGMLTGPVTILKWSFTRDDMPVAESAKQIALAIRDEVLDLETAGLRAIQIDEAAFREALPLRASKRGEYFDWAASCFRLATSGVADGTQIHTHMCYSEFADIYEAIVAMDADVISIENSRSQDELLRLLAKKPYPNEIGPGVYDIHSPRVPGEMEMIDLLRRALEVVPAERLWVNPDCGLKTRAWPETRAAVERMVAAARDVRAAGVRATESSSWPKQPLVPLPPPFVDERGAIQPLLEAVMRSAAVITSKKGSIRGNHYHKTDWHYCYMISGAMEYYERPTGSDEPSRKTIARAGQMVFSPPMVDHAMRFLEDTVWITLFRNSRIQDAYEKDTVRVRFIE